MEIPDQPAMEAAGVEAFKRHLSGISTYLEYGSGGSTMFAIKNGIKTVISVESDPAWVAAVKAKAPSNAGINLFHCDVGDVGPFGRPLDDTRIRAFHTYPALPWKYARANNLVPQLVLIDGRFRVACFLFSLMSARVGTPILFDDYLDRPYYHIVEQFCDLKEAHGRMGVFITARNYQTYEIAEQFAKYSLILD